MSTFIIPAKGNTAKDAFWAAVRTHCQLGFDAPSGITEKRNYEIVSDEPLGGEAVRYAMAALNTKPFSNPDHPRAEAVRMSSDLWLFFGRDQENDEPIRWEIPAVIR